jgi:hypothetical protein
MVAKFVAILFLIRQKFWAQSTNEKRMNRVVGPEIPDKIIFDFVRNFEQTQMDGKQVDGVMGRQTPDKTLFCNRQEFGHSVLTWLSISRFA